MGNILLIKGVSQYEAMRNYIEEIELGFRMAGYNTYVIDAKEETFLYSIGKLSENTEIDLIFTCNAIIAEHLRDWFPNTYYVTYLCDHPIWHVIRLNNLDEKCMIFTCDERHEAYIKKYCKNIKYVKFIPLSGSYLKKYIPYKERTRDIVFTGSYIKPEKKYEDILKYEGVLQVFAKNMAERMIVQPEQDIEVCLKRTLENFNVKVSETEFYELASEFGCIDKYAGSYYRDKVIRSLVENDLKVHVFGNGWENFEGKGKENLIIEKGNFYIALKAVADTKISLNVMPWFKAGFQERIATAMLSGTVAVTDESAYIVNEFENNKDLVIYSLKEIEELPKRIRKLLESSEEVEKIACNGMKRAECSMTWQHRTDDMIQYIQEYFQIIPDQNEKNGEVLYITYDTANPHAVAEDVINSMNEIVDTIEETMLYDKMELCDIDYFYSKFLFQFFKLKANYPELKLNETIHEYLMSLTDEQILIGTELLIGECTRIRAIFLELERNELYKDMQKLQSGLKQMKKLMNI